MCATGVRSAAVTGYLLRSGWTDVTNVEGGIVAWQRAGLPVERGSLGPTGPSQAGSRFNAPRIQDRPALPAVLTVPRRRRSTNRLMNARLCSWWANAQPMISRMMKFTVPTSAAFM